MIIFWNHEMMYKSYLITIIVDDVCIYICELIYVVNIGVHSMSSETEYKQTNTILYNYINYINQNES